MDAHTMEKNRSYSLQASVDPGEMVVALRDIVQYGVVVIEKDEPVKVISYSNAGFRGIEVGVLDSAGLRHWGISAGAFGRP